MIAAAPAFRFDPIRHEYFLGDERLPSVTEMIRLGGLIGNAELYYTPASRLRGQVVHQRACDYDLGSLAVPLPDMGYRGYVSAYVDAMKTIQPTAFDGSPGWEEIEVYDYHPAFKYGTRRDRVGIVWGRKTILEIKTGAKHARAHGAQLALHAISAEARYQLPAGMWQRLGLELKPSGKFTPWAFEDPRDFNEANDLIRKFCQC